MIKLGQSVKDKLTGFTGIVEGITDYLNGCRQALIRPKFKVKDDAYPTAAWIDVEQLSVVKGSKILKLNARKEELPSGGVRRTPPSRRSV